MGGVHISDPLVENRSWVIAARGPLPRKAEDREPDDGTRKLTRSVIPDSIRDPSCPIAET